MHRRIFRDFGLETDYTFVVGHRLILQRTAQSLGVEIQTRAARPGAVREHNNFKQLNYCDGIVY